MRDGRIFADDLGLKYDGIKEDNRQKGGVRSETEQ